MLTWVGKRPLTRVTAFPAQLVERHDAFSIHGIPHHEPDTGEPQTEFLSALGASWNRECRKDDPSLPAPEIGGQLFHGARLVGHMVDGRWSGDPDAIGRSNASAGARARGRTHWPAPH